MLDDLSLQVQSIYDAQGKNKKGLACFCPNPSPSVSLLEMLPAALELSTGENLREVLSMLGRGPQKCLFFHEGKCQMPSVRPPPCLYPTEIELLEKLREKLSELSPAWTETAMPINQALLQALEKMLLLSSGANNRT